MHITIYADVLFITNLFSNLYLLLCTKKLTKNSAHFMRQLAGALLGSIYAVLLFFPSLSLLQSTMCKLLILLTLLCISFRFYSLKQFLQCALWFFSVHLLTGGLGYALFFMTQLGIQTGTVCSNGIFYWHVPIYIVLLAFIGAYGVLCATEKLLTFHAARKTNIYTLQISLNGTRITLPALMDTGNALYDPLYSLPVIIAEQNTISFIEATHSHTVPYRTLAGETRTLSAVRPDFVTIDGITAPPCILAFTDTRLSFDGQYRALLHPALIQGGPYEYLAKSTADKQAAIQAASK